MWSPNVFKFKGLSLTSGAEIGPFYCLLIIIAKAIIKAIVMIVMPVKA